MMSKQYKTGAPTLKFVQRRGVRGFNIRPMPAHRPDPTPTPPAPKWRIPVAERRSQ